MKDYEIVKIRKTTKGWLVHINIIPEYCGCTFNRRVIEFIQEKEPTVEQIENEIKNRR